MLDPPVVMSPPTVEAMLCHVDVVVVMNNGVATFDQTTEKMR